MIDPVIALIVSTAIAVLFASAALSKLAARAEFKAALAAYDILPSGALGMASYIVPVCELLIVAGLVPPATRAVAIGLAASILSGYALAIAVNLRRGRRYIDCGCGGFGKRRPIAPWMVARNLSLSLLLVLCDVVPDSVRPLHWMDAVTVLGAVVIISFLYLALEELLGRPPHLARAGAPAG
jgi:Methylamine utilisation protein MauE